jgi:hypothetical protein
MGETMDQGTVDVILSLVPMMLIQLGFALMVGGLARRVGANPFLWTVLVLIPILGFVFLYYCLFRIIAYMLDSLNELKRAQ